MKQQKHWSPYAAGILLGAVLLTAFLLMGRGLGSSGAMMRLDVWTLNQVVPEHTASNPYFAKYSENPFSNWLVFQVLGVMIGGLISGLLAGRVKIKIGKGERISVKMRLIFALSGGLLMGFAARLARGCASGLALTGGASFALSGWIFMMCLFAGGFLAAWFFRKQWI
jgi:uncharacterized membrane protein YedE/YeeE